MRPPLLPPFASRQLARPREHRVEHWLGQLSREGVLLARVVAADQGQAVRLVLRSVAELRLRANRSEQAHRRVPGEGAKADDRLQLGQQVQLLPRIGETVVA